MGARGSRNTGSNTGGLGFGNSSANANISITQVQQQNIVGTATQANAANNAAFKDTDTQGYHDLFAGRQYFNNQVFDIDGEIVRQDYLSEKPEPGSLYSISQNLNEALRTGQPLTANQQYMSDVLSESMHNLGYNLNLQRYDHYQFLESFGIKNYWNMSESQLKSALVGTEFTDKRFVSTSYNNFKNAPSNNPFTDREVKLTYRAPAATQAFMPGDGRGGRLGEIILDKNQSYKIVDIRYTGSQGRNKSSWYPQVEIIIEVQKKK